MRIQERLDPRELVQRLAMATFHHDVLGDVGKSVRLQALHHRVRHLLRRPGFVPCGRNEQDRAIDVLDRDRGTLHCPGVSHHLLECAAQVPIQHNPEAGAAGRGIGTLFVAWVVLAYVLKQRWNGSVLTDERDLRIEQLSACWGRGATIAAVVGIAVMLGFSPTDRVQAFSYPMLAQMLIGALVLGAWFDHAVAALLYWRDRRVAAA